MPPPTQTRTDEKSESRKALFPAAGYSRRENGNFSFSKLYFPSSIREARAAHPPLANVRVSLYVSICCMESKLSALLQTTLTAGCLREGQKSTTSCSGFQNKGHIFKKMTWLCSWFGWFRKGCATCLLCLRENHVVGPSCRESGSVKWRPFVCCVFFPHRSMILKCCIPEFLHCFHFFFFLSN